MAKAPASKEGLKFCPLINRTCIGDDCAWWLELWGIDSDGKKVLDAECSVSWQPILMRQQLIETGRTTAGQDKVANETRMLTTVIHNGLQERNTPERLTGER